MSRPEAEPRGETGAVSGPLELHAEERGSGRPLIVLHGLLGSLANWRGVARTLSETFHVVSLDARNHGRSPHAGVHDYASMAADTARAIVSRGLAPAVVMGHSMGGKTAMTLALERPELVDKLVVVDIAPRAYREAEGPADVVEALTRVDLDAARSRDDVDVQLAALVPDAATRSFLLMNLRRETDGRFSWRCNLEVLARSAQSVGAEVSCERTYDGPTLFLRGGWSRYVTGSDEGRILRLFPSARIVTLPEAGHWLHAEAPDALVEAVTGFAAAAVVSDGDGDPGPHGGAGNGRQD